MKIHRYLIKPTTKIPKGAVFIDAQPSTTGLSAWFLCDPEAELEERHFAVIATGQEVPEAILDCHHLVTMKAIIPCGSNAVATALHIFDTTQAKEKIPSLKVGQSQPSTDPADWWKE